MSAPRRALVTGAGGFIGANLCRRLLRDGHAVHAVVRPGGDRWRLAAIGGEIAVHEVDLLDAAALRAALGAARPDWLFHLAAHGAYSWQTESAAIFATNAAASAQLLDMACERGFDAFVQAGSASEYGPRDRPARESEPVDPRSAYSVSKAAATHYARAAALDRDVHAMTLRLCSAYGPWEDPHRLVPTLAAYGLNGRLPPLADPRAALDFVFVDDVCEAFVRAARATGLERGTVLNAGSGTRTSLAELVELAREELAIDEPPRWSTIAPRTWDTTAWAADCKLIRRRLGWRPRWGMREGFRHLVDWLDHDPSTRARYTATPLSSQAIERHSRESACAAV
ncbi:MAG TPA: NAD-dependent epimerase/dehydratase family protein [Solirubrobacteraceae bacterium]|nr:NAD-dependent epimerase/dehydratase family protein [Solirubrobacteraceae bacterium]